MDNYLIFRKALCISALALAPVSNVLGMEPARDQKIKNSLRDFDRGTLTERDAKVVGNTIFHTHAGITQQKRDEIIQNAQDLIAKKVLDTAKLTNALAGIELIYPSSTLEQQHNALDPLIQGLKHLRRVDPGTGQPFAGIVKEKPKTSNEKLLDEAIKAFFLGTLGSEHVQDACIILRNMPDSVRNEYKEKYLSEILRVAEETCENSKNRDKIRCAIAGLTLISGVLSNEEEAVQITPLVLDLLDLSNEIEESELSRQQNAIPVVTIAPTGVSGEEPIGFLPGLVGEDPLQRAIGEVRPPVAVKPIERARSSYSRVTKGGAAAAIAALVGGIVYKLWTDDSSKPQAGNSKA